ncbi:chymotrypsin BII-like [Penaeus indicus]|uniref:chymotrypsin BII-like n=1 Tax=Penaeus indicus TaxID=29960 RepID=UPI00300CC847
MLQFVAESMKAPLAALQALAERAQRPEHDQRPTLEEIVEALGEMLRLCQHYSVEVVLGAHNIFEAEDTQVTMSSSDFFTHEDWDSFSLANDIALVRLPTPVDFTESIAPVKLPSSDISVGTTVTPTGWGRPADSADGISNVLRQVDVPVMASEDCDKVYGIIGEGQVCVDTTGGQGTCHGDSGGPLNLNGMTYGVTSFGSSVGCEAGEPDAFTRVFYYLDWIEEKTGVTP